MHLLTPTIGILNWTSDLDIITRKILTMAGALHAARDVDRLYVQMSKGGRGLSSTEDLYEIRTVGMMKHLQEAEEKQFIKASETV